jgi:biotin carboxylase
MKAQKLDLQRVLLLGSSFSAISILRALKKLNFHVTVCGNNPLDPCVEQADAFVELDYSDPKNVLSFSLSQDFDYVIPTCNDSSYFTANVLAEKMGLPGFNGISTTLKLHSKVSFRDLCKELNLNTPPYSKVLRTEPKEDLVEQVKRIGFPLLLKPDAQFSGRGIYKVETFEELFDTLSLDLDWDGYLIESFLNGSLHSHSAFLVNQKIEHEFFVDEYCNTYKYQVDCSNHPSTLSESEKSSVSEQVSSISGHLNLVDGLIHTQFIVDKGKSYLIETMRRCPGDLFPELIRSSTNFDYIHSYISSFIGKEYLYFQRSKNNKNIARHTISVAKETTYVSLSSSIKNPSEFIFYPLKTSGQMLGEAPYDKAGIVFLEFDTKEKLLEITPNLNQFFQINDK